MTVSASSQPPHLIANRYEIERELGHGASAIVYLARDLLFERQVAVKVLREEFAQSLGAERFLREIKMTAQLSHSHIVTVLDHGEDRGRLFFVVPYFTDGTLRDRLRKEPQLPIDTAVEIARSIASALDYAHGKGLVHRDVKPENILFSNGEACLSDFGIARDLLDSTQWTSTTGLARGTPAYMSPEQATAERVLDGRSDIYSLGCVLYEMIAGVPPFNGATAQAVISQRFTHGPEAIGRHRDNVSGELQDVLRRALMRSPADRFATAGEMREALGASPTWRRRNVRRIAMLAGGATFIVSLAAMWGFRPRPIAGATQAGLSIHLAASREEGDPALAAAVSDALGTELAAWPDVRLEPDRIDGSAAVTAVAVSMGDSVRIELDILGESPNDGARRVVRIVPQANVSSGATVGPLVRQVLGGPATDSAPGAESMPGRSRSSLLSYIAGWGHLRAGRLDSAAQRFGAAHDANPAFVYAALWAAQVGAWKAPREVARWRPYANAAAAAARVAGAMPTADSAIAVALDAMAARDYPRACNAFAAATTRNQASFPAWVGRWQCAMLDTVVLQTSRGFEFRSSVWTALGAFREAIERSPSSELLAALFDRAQSSTFAMGNLPRRGWATPDGVMIALPSLVADTIAFFPQRLHEFERGEARTIPETYAPALRKGRAVLLDYTDRWTLRFPASAPAWFNRALALELAEQVGGGQGSADDALARAAIGMQLPAERATIAVTRVRIALRRANFQVAAAIAHGALADTALHHGDAARILLPLAALVGDVPRALTLAQSGPTTADIPRAIADSLGRFDLRAMLGDCSRLRESRDRLEKSALALLAPAELERQRSAVLLPVYRDAIPCIGVDLLNGFAPAVPLDEAIQALAARDRRRARSLLEIIRRRRAGADIASITWDYLYAESWTLVQASDTTTARNQLLGALSGIANLNAYTLSQTSQAAGLRKSIALLREIAPGGDAERIWRPAYIALSPFHPTGQ